MLKNRFRWKTTVRVLPNEVCEDTSLIFKDNNQDTGAVC